MSNLGGQNSCRKGVRFPCRLTKGKPSATETTADFTSQVLFPVEFQLTTLDAIEDSTRATGASKLKRVASAGSKATTALGLLIVGYDSYKERDEVWQRANQEIQKGKLGIDAAAQSVPAEEAMPLVRAQLSQLYDRRRWLTELSKLLKQAAGPALSAAPSEPQQ